MLPDRSYKIVLITTMATMGSFAVFMVVFSVLVRYTQFMTSHPVRFAIETVLVSFLSSIPLYIAAYNRNTRIKVATVQFLILMLKIAVFWVLMELSGVNSLLFPSRAQSACPT